MIVLGLSLFLWLVVLILGLLAHKKDLLKISLQTGVQDFIDLLPRLLVGVIGSGFIAALLPQDLVREYLGQGSGAGGFALAYVAGALTAGGPVIGYTLGASALKAGASLPVIMVYVMAWCVFSLHRFIAYEISLMSKQMIILRHLVALPLPMLAGIIFMLFKI